MGPIRLTSVMSTTTATPITTTRVTLMVLLQLWIIIFYIRIKNDDFYYINENINIIKFYFKK